LKWESNNNFDLNVLSTGSSYYYRSNDISYAPGGEVITMHGDSGPEINLIYASFYSYEYYPYPYYDSSYSAKPASSRYSAVSLVPSSILKDANLSLSIYIDGAVN